MANRTVNGCFVKGESGNPRGRPKATTERRWEARARREVYRQVSNVVVEARKFSARAKIIWFADSTAQRIEI